MGIYGQRVAELELVQAIKTSKGRDRLNEVDVNLLHAMVLEVADKAGDLLAAIPMTFKQYTKHDLLHAENIINLMWCFIPAETRDKLNGVELTVLALVAMLHDVGMYVDEDEKRRIVDSEDFSMLLDRMPDKQRAIKDATAEGRPYAANAIRDAVLADYFRRLHPERAGENIEKHKLSGLLRFREHNLTATVVKICESHGWGVFEATDARHPRNTINSLPTSDPIDWIPFNPRYVAVCLRLADILDFDRSRTPLALLKTITDETSLTEWNKHLQITGHNITDRDVAFHAKCARPEHYVAVMEFFDLIDAELRDCRRLMRQQTKETSERYPYNLPASLDRFDVEMADPSYLRGPFHFEIDYERIMKLLMDKSLYPDPSLFLRELLQNSLDACRARMANLDSEGARFLYTPRITVWDGSDDASDPTLVFQDNGIGMSRSMIEKYFMRVGQSYYRSMEFESAQKRLRSAGVNLEAMSQFGIGFLSCFMVADRIEIETYNDQSKSLRILIEGPTKYLGIQEPPEPERQRFPIQGKTSKTDGPPVFAGTRIRMHLRPGTKISVYDALDRFAANTEIPIEIVSGTFPEPRVIPPHRWENATLTADVMTEAFQSVSDESPLPSTLIDLVTPLFVPIEEYDFCEGLRGRLWFWMFRDIDGTPVPRRGHLRIHSTIAVSGLPALAARVRSVYTNVNELLDDDGISRPPDAATLIPESSFWVSEFNAWWRAASADEQMTVSKWFSQSPARESWHAIAGLPAILARGDWSWAEHAAAFSSSYFSILGPERLSFYGIDLPAGIIEWNPMSGSGRRVRLPPGAGCRIDVRTRVPRPAANRLFVDMAEGARIGIPLLRALLRFGLHMLTLHRQNDMGASWKAWFDGIFSTIDRHDASMQYWEKAVFAERDLIGEVLSVEITDGPSVIEMPFKDVRAQFGRWAPIRRPRNSASAPRLRDTVRNRLLLFGHPIRQTDEEVEIDLDKRTEDLVTWALV